MKKLGLATTIALSALLLSGCGKDSSSDNNKNAIKERDVIAIYQNVYNGRCQEKANEIKEVVRNEDLKNTIVSTERQDVNCATYDRTNDFQTCFELDLQDGTETCVVAFDYGLVQKNKYLKEDTAQSLDVKEIIFSELL